MWILRFSNRVTGKEKIKSFNTFAEAEQSYRDNLEFISYGALYKADNPEETELADSLFRLSRQEPYEEKY